MQTLIEGMMAPLVAGPFQEGIMGILCNMGPNPLYQRPLRRYGPRANGKAKENCLEAG